MTKAKIEIACITCKHKELTKLGSYICGLEKPLTCFYQGKCKYNFPKRAQFTYSLWEPEEKYQQLDIRKEKI